MAKTKYQIRELMQFEHVDEVLEFFGDNRGLDVNAVIGVYTIDKLVVIKKFLEKQYGKDDNRSIIFESHSHFRLPRSFLVYVISKIGDEE